jgi:hypothetical protein
VAPPEHIPRGFCKNELTKSRKNGRSRMAFPTGFSIINSIKIQKSKNNPQIAAETLLQF